jgi:hypothetical protein
MKINNLKPQPDKHYFEHNFMILLESHLSFLKNSTNMAVKEITQLQAYKYEGDFYGLLDDIGIPKIFHYITGIVNDYPSSSDFKGDRVYILLPNISDIQGIMQIYRTKNIF